jgi:hypothetical protein
VSQLKQVQYGAELLVSLPVPGCLVWRSLFLIEWVTGGVL